MMFRNFRSLVRVGVVGAAFLIGCGPDRGDGNAHSNTDPNSNGPGVDMAGATFDGGYSDKCGVQNFMLQPGLPPEVMIVLDRSGSMTSDFDGGTRWSKISDAVNQVVAGLQGMIGWGLTVFPTDSNCGTSSTVAVDVANMNASAIAAKIMSYSPDGNTPTADAISKAAAYMEARTTPNPKYLLLSTDGEPNCGTLGSQCLCPLGGSVNAMGQCCAGSICYGPCLTVPTDSGATDAVKAVTDAATAGVHTFVLGVASDSGDSDTLNMLATAGDEPQSGSTKYYEITSSMDLVTAVNTIAGQIISCSFQLSSPPPMDLSLVEVDLDGNMVPHDTTHANGWDFGPANKSIQFYGPACTSLQMNAAAMIQAIYHCPPTL
jgi:hypothetical protein